MAHILSFYPRRSKLSLIFGRVFKLSQLVKVLEVAHTLSFYPRVEGELIFALRAAVPEMRECTIFKIAVFGHETWQLAKIPEVSHIKNLFITHVVEIYLISLYGQRFPRYRPIFKIAIFGHGTWPLAKALEVANTLSFYPMGSKLSLISLYRQRFLR